MPFADCRKIVKQGDTLKIRWLDTTGSTVNCDIYTPDMTKTTTTMTENPAGSGIYELSYAFNSGDGDYLFVVSGEGLQVSSISELAEIGDIKTQTDQLQFDGSNNVKSIAQNPELANLDVKVSDVKTNTDLIPDIKTQTDQLQFAQTGFIKAIIDDSQLAKERTLKSQKTEIERLRNRMRIR